MCCERCKTTFVGDTPLCPRCEATADAERAVQTLVASVGKLKNWVRVFCVLRTLTVLLLTVLLIVVPHALGRLMFGVLLVTALVLVPWLWREARLWFTRDRLIKAGRLDEVAEDLANGSGIFCQFRDGKRLLQGRHKDFLLIMYDGTRAEIDSALRTMATADWTARQE